MANESSMPPPPPSGGGAKYVVILLILALGGAGIWFAMRSSEPEAAPPPPPPPPKAERSTSLADDSLQIPDEEELEEIEEEEEQVAEPEKPKRPARPSRGAWQCSGDLPPAEIRKVINGSRTAIRSCYERRLKSQNMLQGSLNLQVKVGPNGQVVATRVRGSLRDPDVRSCVQGQARSWQFPSPKGGCVVFDAPYNFTPKN